MHGKRTKPPTTHTRDAVGTKKTRICKRICAIATACAS